MKTSPTPLIVAGVSELCPPACHAVAAKLAPLHQFHCPVRSLLSQHIRDLAELQADLKLLLPHAPKRRLKLAQLVLGVKTNQPQSSIIATLVIRLQGKKTDIVESLPFLPPSPSPLLFPPSCPFLTPLPPSPLGPYPS